jgi:signal recognition particle receptor subunit beta
MLERISEQIYSLSPPLKAALAVRAAMRMAPALAELHGFPIWTHHYRSNGLLALMRCYQVSMFITRLEPLTKNLAAYAAIELAHDAAVEAAKAIPVLGCFVMDDVATAACIAAQAANYAIDPTATDDDPAVTAIMRSLRAARPADRAWAPLESDLHFFLGATNTPSPELAKSLLQKPLWLDEGMPEHMQRLWSGFQQSVLELNEEFEVWLEWYQQRLEGRAIDWAAEERWALLSRERLAQTPAEINAHLKILQVGAAEKQLNRVRAIFIGHGGTGKTSIINALHDEAVIEGQEAMTKGIAIQDSIHESAGVFTRVSPLSNSETIVHFWDFGGQVMAHATHQFFLRAKCLYVIMIEARKERNANEEAEYWLEHVRAFGDSSPAMLVGNKSDLLPVNLDLRSLRDKYPNVVGFYSLSCTQAKTRLRENFAVFKRDFIEQLLGLSSRTERFTDDQFGVLEAVQREAENHDFLSQARFDEICVKHGIPASGPSGRDSLLDLFDKLGVVMHFPNLPYLSDFVLNPRWLTYGVYAIMYSERVVAAKGRITVKEVVDLLRVATLRLPGGRSLRYPAERCTLIVEAMVAFRVAYRLTRDAQRLVIPELLEAQQPEYDFSFDDAMTFQIDFGGFLPRHVLPTLVVDRNTDIAENSDGQQLVWQNGVFFRPQRGIDAEALVRADYHERRINICVRRSDAATYLGFIRDTILCTLATMPGLAYEERLLLRSTMRADADSKALGDQPVWMPFKIIQSAQKNHLTQVPGPDGHLYELEKVLSEMPLSPDLAPADIFISYSHSDRETVDALVNHLRRWGFSVWFDAGLVGGQQFRDVIDQRIDAAKAVVVLWTQSSIGSRYVRHEASRGSQKNKLICLYEPTLAINSIPGPFADNDHMVSMWDHEGLKTALALKGVRRG